MTNAPGPAGEPIPGARVRLVLVPLDVLERVADVQRIARAPRRHPSGQRPAATEPTVHASGPAGDDGHDRAGGDAEPDAVDWDGVGTFSPELVATLPATRRLLQLRTDPAVAPWLARAVVVADESSPTGLRIVGHLGGHGPPDTDGMVEVGYTIATRDRRQGFASEAAAAWFAWAHAHGATTARLSTTPDNTASRGVARRLGLVEVAGAWDDDDACWELVHEAPLPLRIVTDRPH